VELVDGTTLREGSAGALPSKKILDIAVQIADGLAKAHAAGIVHRDLKPENVMVSKDGYVKILDFGLAKLVEAKAGDGAGLPTSAPTATREGMVMGTVGYMSPEQASGAALDFRSDQFSFGAILYEITTGRRAFQRNTAAETLTAVIRGSRADRAGEPEDARRTAVDHRTLPRKGSDERYASTKDLARDLRACGAPA
jgi:serine/threonine protein kinase